MKKQFLSFFALVAVGVVLIASGCSDSSPSDRSAAGASGSTLAESDLNEFCAPPRDSNENPGFKYVRNIVTCFVLQNETKTFSAPNRLNEKTPLTVTRAFCSGSTDVCRDETGYYGDIRTEGLGKQYGWRTLTPNPFTGLAAMQFMPNKIWQGAINRIFVTSSSAPF
jgi:hypothetical protein